MALGTPTDGGAAYSASGGTTVAPAYPAGVAAGDCLVLIVGQKPSTANGGTVTTPTGWTLRESLTGAGGYGATLGADTGNTNLFIYTKDTVAGNETGNLTVTVGTNNVCWGIIVLIPTDGGTLAYGAADGSRTTAPTSGTPFTTLLTNGATAPNLKSGDMAIWAMCIPTDVLNNGFTAPTISSTGTTFGTAVELEEPDSGTGNDIGGYVAYAAATAGSSTAAPTVGVTATGTVTNVRGPIALIRVRELPFINAEAGSFTYTGQDATVTADRALNAESGTFTYTGQDAFFSLAKNFNAEAGTFSYLGQDATLSRSYSFNAEAGTFSYLGQDATLTRSYSFNAEAGTFSYTGQAATLNRSYSFNAEAGSFSYTGQNATLNRTYVFDAEDGTFTYLGQDAELLYVQARTIDAEAGTFTYTGQNATLLKTYSFNAEAGTFTYTGQNAELTYSGSAKSINAEAGSFTITGQPATFEAAAAFDAGIFVITGQDATFLRSYKFNAEAAAFGEANPYVDPGYVDPYYSTNLTASFSLGRTFNAAAGSFAYLGQNASLITGTLFPPEADVREGVIYGPGGIYVGTYVPATKQPLYIFDD